MRLMDPIQLKRYLDSCTEQPLLLDVREQWEFDICHIENSELLPMSVLASQTDELDPERETVVICHHGIRSLQVCHYLEHLGFTNLINLEGGVEAWAHSVDLDMPKYQGA